MVDRMKRSAQSRRTFIDLFAGCGGFSLGLFEAGWQGLLAVERDQFAFRSLQANFLSKGCRYQYQWPAAIPQAPLDIMELLEERAVQIRELGREGIDLVCGGPPCQGFSFSGRRRRNDPRNRLIEAYAAFVRLVGPKYILVENVPGILVPHGTKARRAADPHGVGRPPTSFAQRLHDLLGAEDGPGGGYEFDKCLIDASDFGVPQRRRRYFGFGVRRDILGQQALNGFVARDVLYSIREQHLNSVGLGGKRVSVREAIGDMLVKKHDRRPCEDPDSPRGRFDELAYTPPSTLNRYLRLMRHNMNGKAPDSTRLARHTKEVEQRFEYILRTYRRGVRLNDAARGELCTNKLRIVPLDGDQPSHTVTTLPDDILHYAEPRILTVRELARLQSFPDWFSFKGKFTTGGDRRTKECPRYTQVGNAVPPLLARAWGMAIAAFDANRHC